MSGGFRMSLGGGVAGTPQASLSVFGDGDSDEDKEETPQRSGGVRFKTQSRAPMMAGGGVVSSTSSTSTSNSSSSGVVADSSLAGGSLPLKRRKVGEEGIAQDQVGTAGGGGGGGGGESRFMTGKDMTAPRAGVAPAVEGGPPTPADPVLQERIDKLAHFVARHGPLVEGMVLRKNRENPQLMFLYVFSSPECAYYRHRLRVERDFMTLPPFDSKTSEFNTMESLSRATGSSSVLSSGNDLLGTRVMMPGSFRREHGVMGEEDERGAAGSEMRGRTRAGVSVASYLPEEEMRKFTQQVMEAKGLAAKEEEKLVLDSSNNKGARLMEKMGWGGAGLGAQGQGRVAPVEAKQRAQGLGIGAGGDTVEVKSTDDAFDIYKKRMMLAYRHRPNPLNNPRKKYW